MTRVVQTDLCPPHSFWLWPLLAVLPLIIAAGVLENPRGGLGLPEESAYRSPLSDALMESSRWRVPQHDHKAWREQPPPPVGWRTSPQPLPKTPSSKRPLDLFPRYAPGKTSDYDSISGEEKPLIKVFEFGSK